MLINTADGLVIWCFRAAVLCWEIPREQREQRSHEVHALLLGFVFSVLDVRVNGYYHSYERGVGAIKAHRVADQVQLAPVLVRDHTAVALIPVEDQLLIQ